MRDRAFRRFQELKKKKWVQKVFHKWRPLDETSVGIIAHSPATCSCYACGNPRKWWDQKTMQEKKMDDFYKATDEDSE
jgi:hypothetical protein